MLSLQPFPYPPPLILQRNLQEKCAATLIGIGVIYFRFVNTPRRRRRPSGYLDDCHNNNNNYTEGNLGTEQN